MRGAEDELLMGGVDGAPVNEDDLRSGSGGWRGWGGE